MEESKGKIMTEYKKSNYVKFVSDMEKAGLTPYHYQGRYFYNGPAVNVNHLQEAMSNTKIMCQWDNMGKGFVVYPVAPGKDI